MVGLVAAAAAAMLLFTGTASACEGASLLTVPAQVAEPSQALAANITFMTEGLAAGTPVEIRWNSMEGSAVASMPASAPGQSATINVNVPDVAPGVYYLYLASDHGEKLASQAVEVGGGRQASALSSAGLSQHAERGASPPPPPPLPFKAGAGLLVLGLTAMSVAGVAGLRRARARATN